MITDPAMLMAIYDEGRITRVDLMCRLMDLATVCPVESIVPHVPEEMLAEIREQARRPAKAEEVRIIFGGTFAGDFDWEAFQKKAARMYADGLNRWHAYFAGGESVAPPGL
jgi:hypothetical protein